MQLFGVQHAHSMKLVSKLNNAIQTERIYFLTEVCLCEVFDGTHLSIQLKPCD